MKFSASKSFYDAAVQLEHKFSEIIFSVVFKMTPACMLMPLFMYSNFIYFTTDLTGDAFVLLPFLMW